MMRVLLIMKWYCFVGMQREAAWCVYMCDIMWSWFVVFGGVLGAWDISEWVRKPRLSYLADDDPIASLFDAKPPRGSALDGKIDQMIMILLMVWAVREMIGILWLRIHDGWFVVSVIGAPIRVLGGRWVAQFETIARVLWSGFLIPTTKHLRRLCGVVCVCLVVVVVAVDFNTNECTHT